MDTPSPTPFLRTLPLAGLVFAALLCFETPAASAEQTGYVASNYSDRYHSPDCKIAGKIGPDELVRFATPEEAVAAELVPCKKCNPPASSVKDPRG